MQQEFLQNINVASTGLRLLLALVCGGLLGLERGKKSALRASGHTCLYVSAQRLP